MATTLTLTNGTTTIQLNNGAPWSLEHDGLNWLWSPASNPWLVADPDAGQYGATDERIPIIGNASTQTSLRTSLQTLYQAINAIAVAWDGGTALSALWRIQWTPEGSATTYESVLINGSCTLLEHPIPATGGAMVRVSLQVTRRGRWLAAAPTAGSSTAIRQTGTLVTNAVVTPPAFSDATLPRCPAEIYTDCNEANALSVAGGMALFVAPAAASNQVSLLMSAWGTTIGGAFSNQTESGRGVVRGTSQLLRYTPSGTSQTLSPASVSITQQLRGQVYDLWAIMRNNSSTTTFTVWPQYTRGGQGFTGPPCTIDPHSGVATPRLYFLGRTVIGFERTYDASATLTINFLIQASAASGSIDCDTFVLICADGDECFTIVSTYAPLNQAPFVVRSGEIQNDREARVGRFPATSSTYDATSQVVPYLGHADITVPQAPAFCLYGPSYDGTTNYYWTVRTGVSPTYVVSRRLAYLIPE